MYVLRNSRYPYCYSRAEDAPDVYESWTRHPWPMTFQDSELVLNPWEHLRDTTEQERRESGPFGLARTFARGSMFRFRRDGREYIVMWCDLDHVAG